jgi:hypothetical protein
MDCFALRDQEKIRDSAKISLASGFGDTVIIDLVI